MKKTLALLLLLAACAAPAFAETIDNPVYKSWAKFGVGTTVSYKSTADMAGTKTESKMTYKLLELTPEKAVVEMSTSMEVAGQKIDTPPQKMEHQAKVDGTPADVKTSEVAMDVKNTEEKVETAAGAFACNLMTVKIDAQGSEGASKVWSSDEVPGTLVKSETSLTKPVVTLTTIELVGLEKK